MNQTLQDFLRSPTNGNPLDGLTFRIVRADDD